MKKNNFTYIAIIFLFTLIIAPASLKAQVEIIDTTASDNQKELIAGDFANRLKAQLNLDDGQTNVIQEIIASYVDRKSSLESLENADDTSNEPGGWASAAIEKQLNGPQMASWDSVKAGFWADLNKRINISSTETNQDGE